MHSSAPGLYPTANADVIIDVHYSTHFLRKDEPFRFITRARSDGKLVWVHYGVGDVDPNFKQTP
jgi:hypothetical protein